jgi:hypothetical protein
LYIGFFILLRVSAVNLNRHQAGILIRQTVKREQASPYFIIIIIIIPKGG